MSLPNLSGLQSKKRNELKPGNETNDGIYCLDRKDELSPCDSSVVLKRAALPATPEEFEEAVAFMTNSVRQDQFMGRPVPRKQCTFGPTQYKAYQLVSDESEWPAIVKRVLDATQEFARQLGVENPDEYTGVHANFYPDGDSSVQKHADNENQLVAGAPIFSYTFLHPGGEAGLARDFTIWKMPKGADKIEGKGRLADVTLYSGDLLVMQGEMQTFFLHSIEKQPGKPVASRLNFTVRKFYPKDKMRGEKRPGADL